MFAFPAATAAVRRSLGFLVSAASFSKAASNSYKKQRLMYKHNIDFGTGSKETAIVLYRSWRSFPDLAEYSEPLFVFWWASPCSRILPVQVQPIEAMQSQEVHSRLNKSLTVGRG